MKKILILVVAMFVGESLFSQGIEFKHITFEQALAKAKKENKLVFMDCYTSWCGPCKQLSKEIFTQKEVGDIYNKNFISIKMDMEKGEGVELRERYQITAFPSLLFITPSANVVHKRVGGGDVATLVELAEIALDPNRRLKASHKKYDAGNRDSKFISVYLDKLIVAGESARAKIVSRELLSKKDLEKFITKETIHLLFATKPAYGDMYMDFILKNKSRIEKFVNSYKFSSFLENSFRDYLIAKAKESNSLSEIKNELSKCKKAYQFKDSLGIEVIAYSAYYLEKNQIDEWFNLNENGAIKKCENNPMFGAWEYVNMVNTIIKTPQLSNSKSISDRAITMMKKLGDNKNTKLIYNYSLCLLYINSGEKQLALKHHSNLAEVNARELEGMRINLVDLKKKIDACN
ncbi:thioredoxin family protein [Ancylomarina sp. 16SWW S1-10-2]|uniref:thioredoxin family protein n=1 Tax=Ancylomarina sp. 16SWW S1-10-2 TaxID=2499681 RepID=UPI0012AE0EE3|nr:thioredoxin family protein [Ancylomarina sp. 16SWW S1-10-2]MRT94708.1 DUF255 domain-containing protein [Ancylomarina sp. 16SWW S1-10-2]